MTGTRAAHKVGGWSELGDIVDLRNEIDGGV